MVSEPWLPLSRYVTLRKTFFNILCPWFLHLEIVTMILNLISFLWGPNEFSIGKALGLVPFAEVNYRIRVSHHYNLNTSPRLREVGAASIIWGLPHNMVNEDAGGAEAVWEWYRRRREKSLPPGLQETKCGLNNGRAEVPEAEWKRDRQKCRCRDKSLLCGGGESLWRVGCCSEYLTAKTVTFLADGASHWKLLKY